MTASHKQLQLNMSKRGKKFGFKLEKQNHIRTLYKESNFIKNKSASINLKIFHFNFDL